MAAGLTEVGLPAVVADLLTRAPRNRYLSLSMIARTTNTMTITSRTAPPITMGGTVLAPASGRRPEVQVQTPSDTAMEAPAGALIAPGGKVPAVG
jgi:hypothetical protein